MKTVLLLIVLSASWAWAEDFPGGEGPSVDEFSKGFSEEKGIQIEETKDLETDKLKMGGQFKTEYLNYRFSQATPNSWLGQPQTLSLYLDSRLRNDTRFFAKGQFVYDPSADETQISPFTGQALKRSTSEIEELKIQFNIHKKVFMTLGTQKLKWGSGVFWNPTDFLNSEKRDFLNSEDTRGGLGLIKMHTPFEEHNFYVIGNFENASKNQSVGLALRAELAGGESEMSFSRYEREGLNSKSGIDLSSALGPLDLVFEYAQSDSLQSQSAVGGLSYEWQYSDEDTAIINFEGYWNKEGARSTSEYLGLLLTGKFVPFQVAQAYQLISVYLSKPGLWNDSQVQFFAIRNQIDESCYYRANYDWTGIEDLGLGFSVGQREGTQDSEMKLGGLFSDYSVRASLKF